MPEELTVHVNRKRRHEIEVADGPFEASGSFEVVLVNHGQGAHVHIGLDGDLAAAGAVETPSPFLDAESTQRVPVAVEAAGPFGGVLTLSTGYGQASIEVPVHVVADEGAAVDARPTPSGSAGVLPAVAERLSALTGGSSAAGDESPVDPATVGLVALAAGALAVAWLVASLVESGVVLAGVVVVVAAVAGALAFLVKQ